MLFQSDATGLIPGDVDGTIRDAFVIEVDTGRGRAGLDLVRSHAKLPVNRLGGGVLCIRAV